MRKLRVLLLLLLTGLVATTDLAHGQPVAGYGVMLGENDQRRFNYFFLEGMNHLNAGNMSNAFSLFRHCLHINPDAPEAHYAMSKVYDAMNSDSSAVQHLARAAELALDNDTYQEDLASHYLATGNYDKATQVYEQYAERHHDRSDIYSLLARLYEHGENYEKMLRAVEQIERNEGVSEAITLEKMRAYDFMGKPKEALKSLRQLVGQHPNEVSYRVMLGNWYAQHDERAKALRIYNEALADEPDNNDLLSAIYDYYVQSDNDSLLAVYRDRLLINRDTQTQTKVRLIKLAMDMNELDGGDSTKMMQLFDRVIKVNPDDTDMHELKIGYMILKGMPNDSIDMALRQSLAKVPDDATLRAKLIEMLWDGDDKDGVIAESKLGTLYNPDELMFYYFLGLAHYQKGDDMSAYDALRQGVGVKDEKSNTGLVSDMYAIMGDILHGQGRAREAYAAYDSCLIWNADNVSALNNYAYYLSEGDSALDKAEQMSYKTIAAQPTNSTFLDTYAWILYKQERYAEALIYADQAVANDTDSVASSVILEHAGDIHLKTGDTQGALELWNRALGNAGDTEALLREKIKRYAKEEKQGK